MNKYRKQSAVLRLCHSCHTWQEQETVLDHYWVANEIAHYESLNQELLNPEIGSAPKPHHLIHYCEKTAGMLSFISDFVTGRRTSVKLGKYLKKETSFCNEMIKEAVGKFKAGDSRLMKFHIIEEETQALKRYRRGHNSDLETCMSKHRDSFDSDFHPMRVLFRSPDIGVAVAETDEGRVVARAVVNVTTKRYPMIYGDQFLLQAMLENAGYKHTDLVGAVLPLIYGDMGEDTVVLPYIDGHRDIGCSSPDHNTARFEADTCEDTITIVRDGGFTHSEIDGVVRLNTCGQYGSCDDCGDEFGSEEESCYVEYNDRTVCSSCEENGYALAYTEVHSGEVLVPEEDIEVLAEDGTRFTTEAAAESEDYRQDTMMEWHPASDLVYSEYMEEYIHGNDLGDYVEYESVSTGQDFISNTTVLEGHEVLYVNPEDTDSVSDDPDVLEDWENPIELLQFVRDGLKVSRGRDLPSGLQGLARDLIRYDVKEAKEEVYGTGAESIRVFGTLARTYEHYLGDFVTHGWLGDGGEEALPFPAIVGDRCREVAIFSESSSPAWELLAGLEDASRLDREAEELAASTDTLSVVLNRDLSGVERLYVNGQLRQTRYPVDFMEGFSETSYSLTMLGDNRLLTIPEVKDYLRGEGRRLNSEVLNVSASNSPQSAMELAQRELDARGGSIVFDGTESLPMVGTTVTLGDVRRAGMAMTEEATGLSDDQRESIRLGGFTQ